MVSKASAQEGTFHPNDKESINEHTNELTNDQSASAAQDADNEMVAEITRRVQELTIPFS